jgi:hypothetical protein
LIRQWNLMMIIIDLVRWYKYFWRAPNSFTTFTDCCLCDIKMIVLYHRCLKRNMLLVFISNKHILMVRRDSSEQHYSMLSSKFLLTLKSFNSIHNCTPITITRQWYISRRSSILLTNLYRKIIKVLKKFSLH